MTRVGGPSGHHYAHNIPKGPIKGSSLDALPSNPSSIRNNHIPLSETARIFLPESISQSKLCHTSQIKKEVTTLLSMVTLFGIKDGISGSG